MKRFLWAALAAAFFIPVAVWTEVVGRSGSIAGVGGGGTTLPVADTTAVVKGSADGTKLARFEVDGFTTGTTRAFTLPNNDGTIWASGADMFANYQLAANQSLLIKPDAEIVFGSIVDVTANQVGMQAAATPDTGFLGTGTTSNSWSVGEVGDFGSDQNNGPCTTVACANPQIVIHPATASTTQYNAVAYWGHAGRAIKTLTEAAATSVFQVIVASGAGTGGVVDFTVFASDGTDHQTLAGDIEFAAVNKAGVETCTDPTAIGTNLNSNSAGTLTCTFACDETPANAVNIQFNCTSSLVQTTLDVYYQVQLVGPGQVTPQ